MPSFAAFLRGINVGPFTAVKMSDLASLFTGLGYQDVRTYLNSGNVLFRSAETDPTAQARRIEAALRESLGKEIRTLVKTKEQLQAVYDANPFAGSESGPERTLFVSFLFSPLSPEIRQEVAVLGGPLEQIVPFQDEIYTLLTRTAYPKSSLGTNTLLKRWKIDSTVRNWNTLSAVLAKL